MVAVVGGGLDEDQVVGGGDLLVRLVQLEPPLLGRLHLGRYPVLLLQEVAYTQPWHKNI